MARRSSRLQSNGYYDNEGNPIISYKETLHRIFRRYRSRFHRSETISRSNSLDSNSIMDYTMDSSSDIVFMDTYTHSQRDMGSSDRIRDDNSRAPRRTKFKIFAFLLVVLPLCFAFTNLVPLLSSYFLSSAPSHVPSSNTNMDTGYNEMANYVRKLQDELLMLREKLKYLLPDADTWPNFALESQGASVLSHLSSDTYPESGTCVTLLGIPIGHITKSPRTVIQGHSHPVVGRCWPFAGGRGHLVIALSHPVAISHVTLGHISKNLSPTGTISSAAKEFSVFGMKTHDDEGTRLGTFLYDQDGDQVQTFKLTDHKKDVYTHVKLQVETNWGHPDFTCLYNFRVHGKLAD